MFSFVETQLFSRLVQEYLSDEEYCRLQSELIRNPGAGDVVRGSGGVRKLRWATAGRGKRGGYRVICFVRRPKGIIWLLTIYPKSVTDSIPAHVLKKIREAIEGDG
jgi:mRNA-degrading endonuclease RelE of RelBE toxin-antitoxin system